MVCWGKENESEPLDHSGFLSARWLWELWAHPLLGRAHTHRTERRGRLAVLLEATIECSFCIFCTIYIFTAHICSWYWKGIDNTDTIYQQKYRKSHFPRAFWGEWIKVNAGIRTPLRVCYSKDLLQKIVKSRVPAFLTLVHSPLLIGFSIL